MAPNGTSDALPRALGWAKALGEWLLGGRLGEALEARERQAKVAQLRAEAECRDAREVVFDAGCCKGHMDGYGDRTASSYRARLRAMGLDGELAE
ncbi:MAG: hypothetical protein V1772_10460 [Chloroflexota bacterium]